MTTDLTALSTQLRTDANRATELQKAITWLSQAIAADISSTR